MFHEVTEESQKLADRDVVRMLSSRNRQTNLERVLATQSGNEDFSRPLDIRGDKLSPRGLFQLFPFNSVGRRRATRGRSVFFEKRKVVLHVF